MVCFILDGNEMEGGPGGGGVMYGRGGDVHGYYSPQPQFDRRRKPGQNKQNR